MGLFKNKAPLAGSDSDRAANNRQSADAATLTADGNATITNAKDVEHIDLSQLDDTPPRTLTIKTLIMAVSTALGGLIFGYDTGQISGFLEMRVFLEMFGIEDATTNPPTYYFSNVRSGLIVALLSIGTLIGALIAAPLSNRYGRRFCIPWWCLVFSIGVVIQMAVEDGQWVGIVMGRWVAGLGIGAMSVLVPLYMSETTPKQVRGAVVCSYQLFITIGIFVADCINYGTESRSDTGSYRIPMGVGFIWALLLAVGVYLLPESPRWDIKNGNHDRAFNTMTAFYGVSRNHKIVALETREINKNIEATQGNHPWSEVFTGPRMFYRTALAIALQMLQQLTGANYFFYYGTTIFSGVGIRNSYVTAMILGGVNVGSTFLGLYFVERFGRRKCLIGGAIWMFCCFMIFASIGYFKYQPANLAGDTNGEYTYGVIMIVFACLFIVAFASTWGPMVWTAIGEMFPYRYRADAMSLATASNWLWNFMLAFFTPFIVGDINFAYGYVFAGCNAAAAILVFFFLIESSGKTLEEVDAMYLLHVNPLKSSKWTSQMVEDSMNELNTDNLFLAKGGRDIEKRAGRGTAGQHEGVLSNNANNDSTEVQHAETARSA